MNYPKPEQLNIKKSDLKKSGALSYLAVPGYKVKINVLLEEHDFVVGTNATITNRFAVESFEPNNAFALEQINTAQPYEITVTNQNSTATAVKLFDSYNARTSANFDNQMGITITSSVPGVTYGALLAQSESKSFTVGMMYIEVVSGSNSAATATMRAVTRDANGASTTRPIQPRFNPFQQLPNIAEHYQTFIINGYTSIELIMPANTSVRYSFYPFRAPANRTLSVPTNQPPPTIVSVNEDELAAVQITLRQLRDRTSAFEREMAEINNRFASINTNIANEFNDTIFNQRQELLSELAEMNKTFTNQLNLNKPTVKTKKWYDKIGIFIFKIIGKFKNKV